MSILSGLGRYYKCFGPRGVFTIISYRLFGSPKEISVRPPNCHARVYLRVRTTDIVLYESILLDGNKNEYSFDLGYVPKTIVDAGANIGLTSVFFASKYPESRIIAVEAEASNYQMLQKNVAPYPNVSPIHAALWGHDGEIAVGQPDPSSGAGGEWGFVTHEGEGDRVRAVTMRTLMDESKIDELDLVKMDIEGAEKEVFRSPEWIESVKCLMIEMHDRFIPGCSEIVNRAMGGYHSLKIGETTVFFLSVL